VSYTIKRVQASVAPNLRTEVSITLDLDNLPPGTATAYVLALLGAGPAPSEASRDTKGEEADPTATGADTTEPVKPKRKRRTKAEMAAARAAEAEASGASTAVDDGTTEASDASTAEAASPSDEPAPRRRRRGKAAADPTQESTSAEGAGGEETTTRRRGRRASTKSEAPASSPSDDSEISNADLTKAASEAAAVITPRGVKEIMADFDVDDLRKLEDQDVRRRFINKLQDAIEAEQS